VRADPASNGLGRKRAVREPSGEGKAPESQQAGFVPGSALDRPLAGRVRVRGLRPERPLGGVGRRRSGAALRDLRGRGWRQPRGARRQRTDRDRARDARRRRLGRRVHPARDGARPAAHLPARGRQGPLRDAGLERDAAHDADRARLALRGWQRGRRRGRGPGQGPPRSVRGGWRADPLQRRVLAPHRARRSGHRGSRRPAHHRRRAGRPAGAAGGSGGHRDHDLRLLRQQVRLPAARRHGQLRAQAPRARDYRAAHLPGDAARAVRAGVGGHAAARVRRARLPLDHDGAGDPRHGAALHERASGAGRRRTSRSARRSSLLEDPGPLPASLALVQTPATLPRSFTNPAAAGRTRQTQRWPAASCVIRWLRLFNRRPGSPGAGQAGRAGYANGLGQAFCTRGRDEFSGQTLVGERAWPLLPKITTPTRPHRPRGRRAAVRQRLRPPEAARLQNGTSDRNYPIARACWAGATLRPLRRDDQRAGDLRWDWIATAASARPTGCSASARCTGLRTASRVDDSTATTWSSAPAREPHRDYVPFYHYVVPFLGGLSDPGRLRGGSALQSTTSRRTAEAGHEDAHLPSTRTTGST
jgi:hypothetical protein